MVKRSLEEGSAQNSYRSVKNMESLNMYKQFIENSYLESMH
jgi:hypothetical protein